MDPLSISASLIAVLGAAATTLKTIDDVSKLLSYASDEFCFIKNEITDFRIAIHAVEQSLDATEDGSHDAFLARTFGAAKLELTLLNDFLMGQVFSSFDRQGRARARKMKWARERKMVKVRIDTLRQMKQDILLHITARNSAALGKMHFIIQDMHFQLGTINESMDLFRTRTRDFEQGENTIANSQIPPAPNQVDDSHVESFIGRNMQFSPYQDHFSQSGTTSPSAEVDSGDVMSVKASCYRRSCRPWCSCQCHRRSTFGIPAFLKTFCGSLFLGYSGLNLWSRECNEPSCEKLVSARLVVSYHFPKWFWNRALTASLTAASVSGFEMLLNLPRPIPYACSTYQHCMNGDVGAMNILFNEGKASPFDVDVEGISLLNNALRYNKFEMCRYLIAKGTNMYQEDQTGFSAYHWAWDKVLSEPHNVVQRQALVKMFPSEDGGLDERQFSRIHKSVLDLIGVHLDLELNVSTNGINAADNQGKTALFWAATRGDIVKIRLLLENGADPMIIPNTGASAGKTLLHKLSSVPALYVDDLVQSLISRGLDVNARDDYGMTPLMSAAVSPGTHQLVTALLDHGAEVNAQENTGVSSFLGSIQNGHLENAKVLQQRGADIELADFEGWTALGSSIFWNMHDSLRFMLAQGAKTAWETCEGETILHVAAQYANGETIAILQSLDLSDIDTMQKNVHGRKAEELAHQRAANELNGADKFKKLLLQIEREKAEKRERVDSLRNGIDPTGEGHAIEHLSAQNISSTGEAVEDDTDDCFEDASEYLC